ncbi:MAG TPA: hypothetical protein VNO17_06285 [Actinomycetota bacterium]|nr:hypothetical protein [Actinomycetota bacterium]
MGFGATGVLEVAATMAIPPVREVVGGSGPSLGGAVTAAFLSGILALSSVGILLRRGAQARAYRAHVERLHSDAEAALRDPLLVLQARRQLGSTTERRRRRERRRGRPERRRG